MNGGALGVKEPKKIIERSTYIRIVIVFGVFLVIAALLTVKLFKLQILDYNYYKTKVIDQMTVATEVNPERGTIYDRNGSVLAANATNYLVCISPHDIINYAEEAAQETVVDEESGDKTPLFDKPLDEFIAEHLAEIIGVEEDLVIQKAALAGRQYEVIKKNVDEETAGKVMEFVEEYGLTRQVYIRPNEYRMYPYSTVAAQVVGFVNSEGKGALGLESYYNNLLEGTKGKYIAAQDAHSDDMPFEYESYINAENGYDIETTIDLRIQTELEAQLEATYKENLPNERVTGIVMNVNTGEILAMATYPPFDLNDPYTFNDIYAAKVEALKAEIGEDHKDYTARRNDILYEMWSNKAVGTLYEPGSTFKILTSAMALEEKLVTPEAGFYCGGSLKVNGYHSPIHCHEHQGHGNLSFAQGLQQSCNPVFMILGERLGIDTFYEYFNSFGFLGRTGIDLAGEEYGIVTPRKDFTGVSLAVYSFGQTFKTTPIQQIRAISAVANGGYLVTPHLLKSIKDSDGNVVAQYSAEPERQVISTDTTKIVTQILEEGVSGNGGAKNAYVKGYKVAAKTGTSEKRDLIAKYGNQPYYRVGSTVAYAPADDPEIAVLIAVDEPTQGVVYGSRVAAPYVSNLLSEVLPYLGYKEQYTAKDLEKVEVAVPSFVDSTLDSAKATLQWLGIGWEIVGDGDTVTAQVPEQGSTISQSKGRVILYTGEEVPVAEVTVPDLIGKTAEVANKMLINAGLNIDFEGDEGQEEGAIVVNQSIPTGTPVAKGTAVTIELRYNDTAD